MIGITKCAVNLRKEPKNANNVIKVIPKGQVLYIIEEETPEEWIKAKFGNNTGYVTAAYVDITSGDDNEDDSPGNDNEGDDSGNETETPKGYGLITYNQDKTITVS